MLKIKQKLTTDTDLLFGWLAPKVLRNSSLINKDRKEGSNIERIQEHRHDHTKKKENLQEKREEAYRKTKKALGALLGLFGSFLALRSFLLCLFFDFSSLEACFFFFRLLRIIRGVKFKKRDR